MPRGAILFPQPASMHVREQPALATSGWELHALAAGLTEFEPAIRGLFADRTRPNGDSRTPVRIDHVDGSPESYRLDVTADGAVVAAADPLGALHAARTLVDLLEACDEGVPCVTIEDRPEMAFRGVFCESYWGSDLMDRQDWFDMIDRLAFLKFNVFAVSLYGCWDLRHDRDRGEFLFVPLDDFPQLSTPHTYRTWDADRSTETTVSYLPKMFEQDFFDEVAAHARSQGMHVIPLFGGPGHSSLIPRLVPELSAVDESGRPTQFGYCVTDERRLEVLRSLFENLIRQHLVPNGIDMLAVPGDEYYPILNVDPDEPTRSFTPYCRCEGCRNLSPAESLVRYFTFVGEILAEHGIRSVNWQDTLEREDGFDLYEEKLASSSMITPIVSWWRYNEPLPRIDADRAWETWITPSPGIIGSLFAQHLGLNIEQMLREGHRAGATGVLAYNMPDPAMHRDYTMLADLAWNYSGSGGGHGFDLRWAARVSPDDPDAARLAYALGDSIIASYALMNYVANHLLPYFSTAPYGEVRFPDDLIRPLSVPTPAFTSTLRQIRDTMRESVGLMPDTKSVSGWPNPGTTWEVEGLRLADHADLFLRFIQLCRRVHDEPLDALDPALRELEADGAALLDRLARQKASYQAPYVLREHLGLIGEFRDAFHRLVERPELLPTPTESWHAWLF